MNALLPFVVLALAPAQTPAPVLRVTTAQVDKGEVMSGPPLSHTFELTHTGTAGTISLIGIETGCGCLRAEANPRLLNPGDTTKVTLMVNTLTQPEGPVSWTGTVKYSLDNNPPMDVTLKLSAKLRREIAVTPPMLALSTTGAIRQVLTVADRRKTPLTVTKASTTNAAFTVEVKTVEAGTTGTKQEILLTAAAELAAGTYEDTVTLTTDDATCPELKVPVKVLKRAVGEFTATPESLSIRLNARQPETSAAAVIRAEGKPVQIAKVECSKPGITVRHSAGSAPLATIRVIVDPAKAGTAGSTEVVVTLTEPSAKLVIIPVTWYAP